MIGSLIITFDEIVDNRGNDSYGIFVNGYQRDRHYTDSNNLYSTYIEKDDVVLLYVHKTVNGSSFENSTVGVERHDYTNDDENGDRGIKITQMPITLISGSSTLDIYEFTILTNPAAYDYEYRINISIVPANNYYTTSRYECYLGDCQLVSSNNLINNSHPLIVGKFYNDLTGATGYVLEIDAVTTNTGGTLTTITTQGYDNCGFICPQPSSEGRYIILKTDEYIGNGTMYPDTQPITRQSNNFGQTITTITGFTNIYSDTDYSTISDAFISGDGKIRLLSDTFSQIVPMTVGGYLYYSHNSGSTYNEVTSVTSGMTRSQRWTGVDGSQNGAYIAVTQNWGPYFYSTDSGTTFSFINNSNKEWIKPVVPDGNPLPMYGLTPDALWRLDSLSGPFVQMTGLTLYPDTRMEDVAISQDRKYMLVSMPLLTASSTDPYGLFLSTDSGATFTNVLIGGIKQMFRESSRVFMSAKGQYMMARHSTDENGYNEYWYSSDYGSTWNVTTDIDSDVAGLFSTFRTDASYSDSLLAQYKINDTTGCLSQNKLYYCNNYNSGCTQLNSFTYNRSCGLTTPISSGFRYLEVIQNKEYDGTEPTYSGPSSPSTPTYGPWYLRGNVTFNWTGAEVNGFEIDGASFNLDYNAYRGDDVETSVDQVNRILFSTTTGSVTTDYFYFNDVEVTGTTITSNDVFFIEGEKLSGTKIIEEITKKIYVDGALYYTDTIYYPYTQSPYIGLTTPFPVGSNIPLPASGTTINLTLDLTFNNLPTSTKYSINITDSGSSSVSCGKPGYNDPIWLSGSLITGATVYTEETLTVPYSGSGQYYKVTQDPIGSYSTYAIRINGSGVITEIVACPTPTPTATPTPTPTPIPPTPTASPTPTATPIVPTATPTPTATAVSPITWALRYKTTYGESTPTGTKEVNGMYLTFNGNTLTRPDFTWVSSSNSLYTFPTNQNYGMDNIIVGRDLCRRSGAGSLTLDQYRVRILVNSVEVYNQLTNITNVSISLCPSSDSRISGTTSITVNGGDSVEVEWTDIFV